MCCLLLGAVHNIHIVCEPFLQFLTPPVHIAQWANMHHFLSVCLSLDNNNLSSRLCSTQEKNLGQFIQDGLLAVAFSMSVGLSL